jgi:hypothetical protein
MIRQDDRAQRVLERFAAGEAYPGALRRAARQTLARLYPAP